VDYYPKSKRLDASNPQLDGLDDDCTMVMVKLLTDLTQPTNNDGLEDDCTMVMVKL